MSHEEKFSRALDGLTYAMHLGELGATVEVLARQIAELKGIEFEECGQQIIDQATGEGHDLYHQRVARKSLELTKKLLHSEKSSEAPPLSPLYEFLKKHGTRIPAGSYEGQPDIPESHRLFDVYDGSGSCTPFCVDVTDPKDWDDGCKNGYENWGGRLACILISEEKLAEFKSSLGPPS